MQKDYRKLERGQKVRKFTLLERVKFPIIRCGKVIELKGWKVEYENGKIKLVRESYIYDVLKKDYGPVNQLVNEDISNEVSSKKTKRSPTWGLTRRQVAENQICSGYETLASKRNYTFELTREQFIELMYQDCSYCGSIPSNSRKIPVTHEIIYYNGIDRIDNTKGYTIENTTACCKRCNMAKNDLSMEEFKNLIKRIYDNIIK